MKNIIQGFALIISLSLAQVLSAQTVNPADSTGLAGDNFSLEGALALFKTAKSPEAFEMALNQEGNSVNNLDLNEDGQTDYVKVIDVGDDTAHALILRVDVNAAESQDIAVITIEKTGAASATVQIRGGEELYGKDLLYEPMEENVKGGVGGPDAVMETYFIYVNVWYWPCVQFIWAPAYVYWVSPWYWDYYPYWWRPWYVRPWRVHYHACYHYRPYYHRSYEYRNYHAYNLYGPRKSTSQTVYNRYEKSTYKAEYDRGMRTEQPVVGSARVQKLESEHITTRPATNGNGKIDNGASTLQEKPSTQENRQSEIERKGATTTPKAEPSNSAVRKSQEQPTDNTIRKTAPAENKRVEPTQPATRDAVREKDTSRERVNTPQPNTRNERNTPATRPQTEPSQRQETKPRTEQPAQPASRPAETNSRKPSNSAPKAEPAERSRPAQSAPKAEPTPRSKPAQSAPKTEPAPRAPQAPSTTPRSNQPSRNGSAAPSQGGSSRGGNSSGTSRRR